VSHIKGRTWAQVVQQEDAEEDSLAYKGESNRKIKRTAL
jgi:hypothetical protein